MQPSPDELRRRACALGEHVRALVYDTGGMDKAAVTGRTAADTI